jgi:hypothetical protein
MVLNQIEIEILSSEINIGFIFDFACFNVLIVN